MPITLNSNEVLSALSNMIFAVHTYSDNIAGTYGELVNMAKRDAGLFGDSKLYVAVDALESSDWTNDSEAANLLALNRPKAPDVQRLVINKFRKVFVTTDDYMTKRAFADEGSFQTFNSVVIGWVVNTKRIYESKTYNAFVGTEVTATGSQSQTITFTEQEYHYYDGTDADSTDADVEATNRIFALELGKKIADILDDLEDAGTTYNDLGFLRSYNRNDMVIVWNAYYLNKLERVGLPTVFHDNAIPELTKYKLPAKYFGTVNSSSKTADSSTRSLIEQVISTKHYFPGDTIASGATAPAGTSYQVNAKVICKIMHKDSVPFLTSFTASTEFFNPRSLTKNNYLIWGHNTLQHLKQYPFITVAEA